MSNMLTYFARLDLFPYRFEQQHLSHFVKNQIEKKNLATSLFKGLDALFLISAYPDGIDIPTVVSLLQQPRSSTVRILDSLQYYGLIERRNRRYFPAARLEWLVGRDPHRALEIEYHRVLERINEETGELVVLSRLEGRQIVPLVAIRGRHRVSVQPTLGIPYAPDVSAMGKIILSMRSDLFRSKRSKRLQEELRLARRHHLAFNFEESEPDVCAIGTWLDAPVPTNPVVSVVWPSFRFSLKEAEKAIATFRRTLPAGAPLSQYEPPLEPYSKLYPRLAQG